MEAALSLSHASNYKKELPCGQQLKFNPFFTSFGTHESFTFSVVTRNGVILDSDTEKEPEYMSHVYTKIGDKKGAHSSSALLAELPKDLRRENTLDILLECANDSIHLGIISYLVRIANSMNNEDLTWDFQYQSNETPITHICEEKPFEPDRKSLAQMVKELSGEIRSKYNISDVDVSFCSVKDNYYFVSSEGSKIFTSNGYSRIAISIEKKDKHRRKEEVNHIYTFKDVSEIPTYEQLLEKSRELIENLDEIIHAPVQGNYIGPTILCGLNHGVFWHEVVGHALEGHRMQPDSSGDRVSIFLDKTGFPVTSQFISISDDPTIKGMHGSFEYDHEGIKSRKVELIKEGILKNFLHSRSSAGYFSEIFGKKVRSNGHSRCDFESLPVPRMSNLMVKSTYEFSYEELKGHLTDICQEFGLPYGLILKDCSGGLTLPEDCMWETYPTNVFRLYPNGKEERVKGVYVVGTPLNAMNSIIATSDKYQTFEGFCGAESGFVPSTQRAPDALFEMMELNTIPESSYVKTSREYFKRPNLWPNGNK